LPSSSRWPITVVVDHAMSRWRSPMQARSQSRMVVNRPLGFVEEEVAGAVVAVHDARAVEHRQVALEPVAAPPP
jgi:hypothetical protein